MRLLGLQAVYRAPRTSAPHPEHRVYPYLLRDLGIERANHVWCADITYIPVRRGHSSTWWRSWTGRAATCWLGGCRTRWTRASARTRWMRPWPRMARRRSSTPTRAASSPASPSPPACGGPIPIEAGIRISMDGRGRCMDNIFIERLWRSLKYEAVYLHEIADGFTARRVIGEWIAFYNTIRPHSALGGRTPGRGLPRRHACGYDGQAASRLDHIPTGATAATERSIQGDSGGLNFNRNTP